MANRSYNNAANMERRAAQKLRDEGWTVWRTPGSKSPADLVAIRGEDFPTWRTRLPMVRLVQAKGGAATMTRKARTEFAQYAEALGAEAWLVTAGLKFSRLSPSGEDATQNDRGRSGIGD